RGLPDTYVVSASQMSCLLLGRLVGCFRHHVPLVARVHREHAVSAGEARRRMRLRVREREEAARWQLAGLAIDAEDERSGHHRAGMVGAVMMERRGEPGDELEVEMAGALCRIAVGGRELDAL